MFQAFYHNYKSIEDYISDIYISATPTGNPSITGLPESTVTYEGETKTLECSQSDGNPLPVLSWEGSCGSGTPTFVNSGTTVTTSRTVSITKEMNGQMCTCKSTHPAYNNSPRRDTLTFLVYCKYIMCIMSTNLIDYVQLPTMYKLKVLNKL